MDPQSFVRRDGSRPTSQGTANAGPSSAPNPSDPEVWAADGGPGRNGRGATGSDRTRAWVGASAASSRTRASKRPQSSSDIARRSALLTHCSGSRGCNGRSPRPWSGCLRRPRRSRSIATISVPAIERADRRPGFNGRDHKTRVRVCQPDCCVHSSGSAPDRARSARHGPWRPSRWESGNLQIVRLVGMRMRKYERRRYRDGPPPFPRCMKKIAHEVVNIANKLPAETEADEPNRDSPGADHPVGTSQAMRGRSRSGTHRPDSCQIGNMSLLLACKLQGSA
ncbi:MAG: hypothetical protein JWN86_3804 [Planctomycetota bacterium]|nr:hypothetical protein [Planctomycetota bacterium]